VNTCLLHSVASLAGIAIRAPAAQQPALGAPGAPLPYDLFLGGDRLPLDRPRLRLELLLLLRLE